MPVHGGKLAARALKKAGVECIFTLSGGHIMPLYDGCIDEGIRIVDVRHEQAAVHAADAWARCNPGKIGVAAITAGPGVTDGVTGVANAWRANSPDPRDRRPGSVREPAPRLAAGDGPRRADAADHEVGGRLLRHAPHRRVRRARHPSRGVGHSRAGIPRDPDGRLHGPAEWEEAMVPPIRTAPPRISPDRADVREALELLSGAASPC